MVSALPILAIAPSAVCNNPLALLALVDDWLSAPSRPLISVEIARPAGSEAAVTIRLPLDNWAIDWLSEAC